MFGISSLSFAAFHITWERFPYGANQYLFPFLHRFVERSPEVRIMWNSNVSRGTGACLPTGILGIVVWKRDGKKSRGGGGG